MTAGSRSSAIRGSSSAVRVSCQTIARLTGFPVCRFHSTDVSRWLVIPSPAICSGPIPASCNAWGSRRCTTLQISSASCSTHPECG